MNSMKRPSRTVSSLSRSLKTSSSTCTLSAMRCLAQSCKTLTINKAGLTSSQRISWKDSTITLLRAMSLLVSAKEEPSCLYLTKRSFIQRDHKRIRPTSLRAVSWPGPSRSSQFLSLSLNKLWRMARILDQELSFSSGRIKPTTWMQSTTNCSQLKSRVSFVSWKGVKALTQIPSASSKKKLRMQELRQMTITSSSQLWDSSSSNWPTTPDNSQVFLNCLLPSCTLSSRFTSWANSTILPQDW